MSANQTERQAAFTEAIAENFEKWEFKAMTTGFEGAANRAIKKITRQGLTRPALGPPASDAGRRHDDQRPRSDARAIGTPAGPASTAGYPAPRPKTHPATRHERATKRARKTAPARPGPGQYAAHFAAGGSW